jgi:hypothetical protein
MSNLYNKPHREVIAYEDDKIQVVDIELHKILEKLFIEVGLKIGQRKKPLIIIKKTLYNV